jgi:hypothetical protein
MPRPFALPCSRPAGGLIRRLVLPQLGALDTLGKLDGNESCSALRCRLADFATVAG